MNMPLGLSIATTKSTITSSPSDLEGTLIRKFTENFHSTLEKKGLGGPSLTTPISDADSLRHLHSEGKIPDANGPYHLLKLIGLNNKIWSWYQMLDYLDRMTQDDVERLFNPKSPGSP